MEKNCNALKLLSISFRCLIFFEQFTENWFENWLAIMSFKLDQKVMTKGQSYKRNLVLKKSKLVLNSLTVSYFTLSYTNCYDLNWSNAPSKNLRLN